MQVQAQYVQDEDPEGRVAVGPTVYELETRATTSVNWYHPQCAMVEFAKCKKTTPVVTAVTDIVEGFDKLSTADQVRIQRAVEGTPATARADAAPEHPSRVPKTRWMR